MKRLAVSVLSAFIIVLSVIPVNATVLDDNTGVELNNGNNTVNKDEGTEENNDVGKDTESETTSQEQIVDSTSDKDEVSDDFFGVVTLTADDGGTSVCVFGEPTAYSVDGEEWINVDASNSKATSFYVEDADASEIKVKGKTDTVVCDIME